CMTRAPSAATSACVLVIPLLLSSRSGAAPAAEPPLRDRDRASPVRVPTAANDPVRATPNGAAGARQLPSVAYRHAGRRGHPRENRATCLPGAPRAGGRT